MKKIKYLFDPANNRLCIMLNGKSSGGFTGAAAERELARVLESGAEIIITNMNDSIKKARVKRLRAIWIKLGIDDYRDAILEPYGVTSTADLNLTQLDELITRYSSEVKKQVTERLRKLRSEILTQLNKMGVYANNGDWNHVNAYLQSNKIAGKLLFELDEQELLTLRRKLHSIAYKSEKK
jgi:hypothetical protein